MGYTSPEPLGQPHLVSDFESGEPALDDWLKRHARQAQSAGSSRTFATTTDGAMVVGYYALAATQVEPSVATTRPLKGEPQRRAIPAVLLVRLAVDHRHQGAGVGHSLLQDAVLRALQAADSIGVRAILIHAKHERARAWYRQYGFESSPTDPHLMLLVKDLRAFVARS